MINALVIMAMLSMLICAVQLISVVVSIVKRRNFKPALAYACLSAVVATGCIMTARAISPARTAENPAPAQEEKAPAQEEKAPAVEEVKEEEPPAPAAEEVKSEPAPVEAPKQEIKKKDDGLSEGNQFKDLAVYEFDVFSEVGRDKLGRRAYINSEITDVKGINTKHLKELYDVKIKGKEYMWFNIKLADGNALTFIGGTDVVISYGPVDKEGAIVEEQIGNFMPTDSAEKPYKFE